MCHFLLAVPLVALSLFWLLPLHGAIVTYGVTAALSAALYWSVIRAMKRPPENGIAALVGHMGTVVACTNDDMRVQVHNELWHARCRGGAQAGDRVEVIGYGDMILMVEKVDAVESASRHTP